VNPDPEKPARFVVTGVKKRSRYAKTGRAIIEGDDLVIYPEDTGRFVMNPVTARYLLLLGGSVPIQASGGEPVHAERRDGGKGLWICRGEDRFVIPARSLMPVLLGKTRKAAVFRWEGREEENNRDITSSQETGSCDPSLMYERGERSEIVSSVR
jgi:hypothetical protein